LPPCLMLWQRGQAVIPKGKAVHRLPEKFKGAPDA